MRKPLGGLFDSEGFCVVLDAIGHRYGIRPSELLGITEPRHMMLGIALDGEVLKRANEFESRALEEIRAGRKVNEGDREEARLQARMKWAKFAQTLPEGELKQRAMERFCG